MTTMTRPTGVKCGNHAQATYHANVAEVRSCYATPAQRAWDRHRPSAAESRLDDAMAAFDVAIQDRERAEDERVAREKMDRDAVALSIPTQRRSVENAELTDGIYRNPQTGDIFKVYITVHGAQQRVAKQLVLLPEDDWYTKTVRGKQVTVKAEFVYRGKAGLRGLTAEMRMTLEEGKKYGAIYGVCIRCAATLTREESIERAMGPVCAGKANWAE